MESPFDYRWTERGKGAPALPSPAAGLPGSKWPDPLLLVQSRRQLRCAKVSAPAGRRFGSRSGGPATIMGGTMKNPLDSLWGTIICGLVLTAILYYVVKSIPL
jgi:hypothetical protein